LYLCDYLGNPSFRTEILNLLNQGESVHSLERAIHAGGIGARRGRTSEQMAAISGALSLLAQHRHGLEHPTDAGPRAAIAGAVSGPTPQSGRADRPCSINMRGTFAFELGPHRKALLGSDRTSPARRAAT
jgi:hypothetical protein